MYLCILSLRFNSISSYTCASQLNCSDCRSGQEFGPVGQGLRRRVQDRCGGAWRGPGRHFLEWANVFAMSSVCQTFTFTHFSFPLSPLFMFPVVSIRSIPFGSISLNFHALQSMSVLFQVHFISIHFIPFQIRHFHLFALASTRIHSISSAASD